MDISIDISMDISMDIHIHGNPAQYSSTVLTLTLIRPSVHLPPCAVYRLLSVCFRELPRRSAAQVSQRYSVSTTGSENSRSTTATCDRSRDETSQQHPQDR